MGIVSTVVFPTLLKKPPMKVDGTPDPEKAKAAGAWIRSRAVEHVKKHKSRFRELFDSSQAYEAFLTKSAQPTTWIEGTMMQAVCERTGRPVIVWALRDQVWTRLVVAGKFDTNGFACAGKGLNPIMVVLRDKHYQVLQCPQGQTIPNSWWKETPSVVIDLSGGVNSKAVTDGTPSLHSFPPDGSCKRARSLAAKLPAPTSAFGQSSSSRGSTSATPSVHTVIRHKTQHVTRTRAHGQNLFCDQFMKTCSEPAVSPSITEVSSRSKRMTEEQLRTPNSDSQFGDSTVRVWTCPYCSIRIESNKPGKDLSIKRANHLN